MNKELEPKLIIFQNLLNAVCIDERDRRLIIKHFMELKKAIESWNTRQSPPPWETPEQYKERTGENWLKSWAVYAAVWKDGKIRDWKVMTHKKAYEERYQLYVIANHHGKPKPDWRPE